MSRFSDLLPPLTSAEYEALKADIAERGVVVPIEVDEDGVILDGAHRDRAAHELGLAPPMRIKRHGMTEEQKRDHALALNAHRRQLAPETREGLITRLRERREEVVRLREEGLSVRRIAETVGAPKSTVARDLAGVPVGHLDSVTGADGKEYPAERPERASTPPVFVGHELSRDAGRLARALAAADLVEVSLDGEASHQLWRLTIDDLVSQLQKWRVLLADDQHGQRDLRRVK